MSKDGIAIIGIDCRYPGAHSTKEYWENILSLRQQFRRIPDKRLNLEYYGSKDKLKRDHTYCENSAVLTNYEFDRLKYKVSKSTFEQTDPAQWLALDVAAGALKDAGFENGHGLDKKRVGVIIGNSLNGEFTRANIMRLRWPYVFKVLEKTLSELDYEQEAIMDILGATEKVYKKPFPEPTADTLAGGLSNTIAGRICNYFDFNGGGFTIDGACSSSLLAFVNGCNAIQNNELEVVLVGGVDLSIDPFELVGFARNGALAPEEMEVYSTKSQGFWPGEGCGVCVLMDAKKAKDLGLNIYGIIKGWGISSDGKGGITRPKAETQQLAYNRAYTKAGYGIDTIAMFEGHGTGTPLGDEVELTAIVNELRHTNKKDRPAIIGSIKHLIGHTKAAAGVAGVLKTCLALKNKVIPPSIANIPHRILKDNSSILGLSEKPILWEDKNPLRASVSAMGFGGINVHLTMEEANPEKRFKKLPNQTKKLFNSSRDVEVFPVIANSKESLIKKLSNYKTLARDISRSEFTDLSTTILSEFSKVGFWRACIVARTPNQLVEKIEKLISVIENNAPKYTNVTESIFFNSTNKKGKIAFLFPGQGAPIYEDNGAFTPFCADYNQELRKNVFKGRVVDTSIAQPLITESTLSSLHILNQIGIEADMGIGHSLGELAALSWAGAFDKDEAINLATLRGKLMSELGEAGGTMLAIKCNGQTLQELIKDREIWITAQNAKNSYVVAGRNESIKELQQAAFELQIQNIHLKVSHAFHTPMMRKAANAFKDQIKGKSFYPLSKQVISTVTGDFLQEEALENYLYKQIEKPVLFDKAISQITEEVEFLFELGPGSSLKKSLKNIDNKVISLNFGSNSVKGLFDAIAASFVIGCDIQFDELSCDRFFRAFDSDNWTLNALVNPCEKFDFESNFLQDLLAAETTKEDKESRTSSSLPIGNLDFDTIDGVISYMKNLISERTEIPTELISSEDRMLSQLHLNSLAISEIISLVTRNCNKSHKVFSAASIMANADGRICDVGKLIFEGESGKSQINRKKEVDFELIPNWTQVFERYELEKTLSKIAVDYGTGTIQLIGSNKSKKSWEKKLNKESLTIGNGMVYIHQPTESKEELLQFMEFLKKDTVKKMNFVMLLNVQKTIEANNLLPLLRTFQFEQPDIIVVSVTVEPSLSNIYEILLNELKAIYKYQEIAYNAKGIRSESNIKAYFPQTENKSLSLIKEEVVLVTGGGKGITFESVLSLAKQTGAKLGILGRSKRKDSQALELNLQKLTEAGITYHYCSADVCNKEEVQKAIVNITNNLGQIVAVVHGAGVNTPKVLDQLTKNDFERTSAVKVDGLVNIIEAIEADQLKLLVGYGSIIAQSGMKGNGDYAWANDQLAKYIDYVQEKFPNCRCLTLEWSVWDEVGMGVHLNSIENLKKEGIFPIPIKQGIETLHKILNDKTCRGRYIIAGRHSSIPTLNFAKKRLPLGRYILNVKHHVPEIEVISEVNINLKEDIYLRNHVFENQFVFPTVMILEGMAQTCSILRPTSNAYTFKNLQILKSIFIPENGNNIIRFFATRIGDNTFKVVAQSEDSDFEVNCFDAEIHFDVETELSAKFEQMDALNTLDLDVEEKFYDDLLFHHGPFRRIKSFLKIQALSAIAVADSNQSDKWFAPFICDNLILGDPGLNDAAIHCHQVCRPGWSLLPTRVGEIVFNSNKMEGPYFIHTTEKEEIGNDTIIDVIVVNKEGKIKEYWKDLVLTKVQGTSFEGIWDPHLLVPHLEYQVMKLTQKRDVEISLESCFNLINSINKSDQKEAIYQSNDFKITLLKKNEEEVKSKATISNTKQRVLEIKLANMNEKALLYIDKAA